MSWLTVTLLALAWLVAAAGVMVLCAAASSADRAAAGLQETLRAHDAATARHSDRVARLCRTTGVAMGMEGGELDDLVMAAALHDLGKLRVPAEILRKPGRLTPEEWDVMAEHPAWGAEMLALQPPLQRVAHLVESHHERTDGQGYPHGIRAEGTPLIARIITVCDAYDAMTSRRPYGEPLSRQAALAELERCAGSQFDPEVVASLSGVLAAARGRRRVQALLHGTWVRPRRAPHPGSSA